MGLKAVLENLDELDTSLHEHYKQDKDSKKYILDVESFDAHPGAQRLKNEAAQHRIKAREAEQALAPFKQLGDLEEIRTKLDKFPELEELAKGKVDEAKIEEIVGQRIKSKLAPIERERDSFKGKVTELEGTVQEFTKKEKSRMIQDAVRGAIAKSTGFQNVAEEDALVFADRHFEVNEAGDVVTKDKVGVTPGVDAAVWLSEMQTKKPHWWGASSGGGAPGNRGGGGSGGSNPFTHEGWNVTEQGNLLKKDRARAEQFAKAAGTTIGGRRPPPKK